MLFKLNDLTGIYIYFDKKWLFVASCTFLLEFCDVKFVSDFRGINAE